jgi:hypothetical protein
MMTVVLVVKSADWRDEVTVSAFPVVRWCEACD